MSENISNNKNIYDKVFNDINREISSKIFVESFKKVQKIDNNHYKEKITIEEMKMYLEEYRNSETSIYKDKRIMILQRGNPELIFKICLEILKSEAVEIVIAIQDFCLGQNTLIVETINEILKQNKINKKIKLENHLNDNKIIEISKDFSKIICIR